MGFYNSSIDYATRHMHAQQRATIRARVTSEETQRENRNRDREANNFDLSKFIRDNLIPIKTFNSKCTIKSLALLISDASSTKVDVCEKQLLKIVIAEGFKCRNTRNNDIILNVSQKSKIFNYN